VGLLVAAAVTIGCTAVTRHRVLSVLFDGVPPLKGAEPSEVHGTSAVPDGGQPRQVGYREHGPYAAKLCAACHNAAATNALLAPGGQLCARCHELALDKKYVHGPLASGGCLACHDPHASQYRYLLVSKSDSFCLRCHDRQALSAVPGHGGTDDNCTRCHEAHMSDKRFLLR